jgi:putative hemolysin
MKKCPPCTEATAHPRPGFRLERPPDNEINKLLADEAALRRHIPPIFKGYLRLGASICGEPALDREFKTIDFFILVDIKNVPERYIRHFKYDEGAAS